MQNVIHFTKDEPDPRVQELEQTYATNPEYHQVDQPDGSRYYIVQWYIDDWKDRLTEWAAIERIIAVQARREEAARAD